MKIEFALAVVLAAPGLALGGPLDALMGDPAAEAVQIALEKIPAGLGDAAAARRARLGQILTAFYRENATQLTGVSVKRFDPENGDFEAEFGLFESARRSQNWKLSEDAGDVCKRVYRMHYVAISQALVATGNVSAAAPIAELRQEDRGQPSAGEELRVSGELGPHAFQCRSSAYGARQL